MWIRLAKPDNADEAVVNADIHSLWRGSDEEVEKVIDGSGSAQITGIGQKLMVMRPRVVDVGKLDSILTPARERQEHVD